MKIKTRDLAGVALDWAVCKAKSDKLAALAIEYPEHAKHFPIISPSTNWNQGGPIIEREKISINIKHDGYWMAFCQYNYMDEKRFFTLGDTPLIAAMRCFVASKLGDVVEVPDELFTTPQPIEPQRNVEPVGYGCHCDLEEGMEPDDCVIDSDQIYDCVYAQIGIRENSKFRKEDCEYWQPINIKNLTSPAIESEPQNEYGLNPADLVINSWSSKPAGNWSIDIPKGIQVVHLPTGTVVEWDAERSQHANRHIALTMLAQKLKAERQI